ncbi:hypothetical protein J6590_040914 [Homalodisca vitripennis]|nr:hypothetical protein J6590_040914 [Homalodisca vitripennis]
MSNWARFLPNIRVVTTLRIKATGLVCYLKSGDHWTCLTSNLRIEKTGLICYLISQLFSKVDAAIRVIAEGNAGGGWVSSNVDACCSVLLMIHSHNWVLIHTLSSVIISQGTRTQGQDADYKYYVKYAGTRLSIQSYTRKKKSQQKNPATFNDAFYIGDVNVEAAAHVLLLGTENQLRSSGIQQTRRRNLKISADCWPDLDVNVTDPAAIGEQNRTSAAANGMGGQKY